MDSDERAICEFLKSYPGQFLAGREVARRAAGSRRFRTNPNWAAPALARLVDTGMLEKDSTGHFRLKPKLEPEKPKKWLSPHIKAILERGGKNFGVSPADLDKPEES